MKILLTGRNRSGKTTLLLKLIGRANNKRGLVAQEVRKDGERIGFDLVDSEGNTSPLARTGKQTPYPVGRYFVDVEALDSFIEPLFTFGPKELLYIDEIGQMQLYSSRFKELVTEYLDADNDCICTITSIYEDEFVKSVRGRQGILTCEVTPDNRARLEEGLAFAVDHRDMVAALLPVVRQAVIGMGMNYLRADDYVRFEKLFKNAVPYIAQGRIKREEGGFFVEGDTNDHHVTVATDGAMACDCDLFNGRGQFEGEEGECSHIQTAMLLELAEESGGDSQA